MALLSVVLGVSFFATGVGSASSAADSSAAAGPADPSAGGWSFDRADLTVRVVAAEGRLVGEARLEFTRTGASGTELFLAMNAREPAMRFTALVADGASSTLDLSSPADAVTTVARLQFDPAVTAGTVVHVRVSWENVGESVQLVAGSGVALASWVEVWYPLPVEPPSLELDATPTVGATVLELPAGWSSVSNGRLVERREGSDGTTDRWEVTSPLSRSFVAAPYRVARQTVGEREIGVYLMSATSLSADNQARTLAAALEAMEDRFGPYPYPSYSIAEVPDDAVSWYASSEQGFIMARTQAFDVVGGNLPLFAHEAAHGWWGNLVHSGGPGRYLCSESLAQYGAVLAIETLEGAPAATEFLRFSRRGYSAQQCARGYFGLWRDGHDRPLAELDGAPWDHALSDAKGHWVYHMLRGRVGDDVFFAVIRGLIAEYAGRTMTLEALRAAFVQGAPAASLEQFFAEWLDRTGAPVLEHTWSALDDGTGVELVLTQLQEGDPFHVRIPVDVHLPGGERLRRLVPLEGERTVVRIETPMTPVDVVIDPDHELLIWTSDYGPSPVDRDPSGG